MDEEEKKNVPLKRTFETDGEMMLLGAMIGGPAFGIDSMQREGQKEMLYIDTLPVSGSTPQKAWDEKGVQYIDDSQEKLLIAMGFKLGPPVEGDEKFFRHATFPPGWTRKRTEHHMYTHVLDNKGRPRLQIGYKAAFYDRWSSLVIYPRFHDQQLRFDPRTKEQLTQGEGGNYYLVKDYDIAFIILDRAKGDIEVHRTKVMCGRRSAETDRSAELTDEELLRKSAWEWVKNQSFDQNDWNV